MSHWAHQFIGMPWTAEKNCWWFVREVYRQQCGIEMPIVVDSVSARLASRVSSMRPIKGQQPQEMDVVIMRSLLDLHAGVVVIASKRVGVLHSTEGMGAVWQLWAEAVEGMKVELWRRR